MTIKVLDKSTIQHLHSGQVIVDIEAIVKELIENSLDAHATSIELVFINSGLESIQIKDDGDGIDESDRHYVAKGHYTSKLATFNDLETITSYGFRGEALNSMCTVSNHVIIMTKTKADVIGKQYDLDKQGTISNEKPTNTISKSGTVVTLYKPFYNLPVRRQLSQRNTAQNNKKCQELLIKYALAHPNVRFSLHQARDTVGYSSNNPNNSWIKPVTASINETLAIIYGSSLANMVERFVETDASHPTLTVDMIVPKQNSDPSIIYKGGGDRVFIYVNQRPINYVKSELKDLVVCIRDRYREAIGLSDHNKKNPFMYVDIQIQPDEYDVNIEPNKTTIYFQDKQLILNHVKQMLNRAYPSNTLDTFFSNKQAQREMNDVVDADQQEQPLFVSQSSLPNVACMPTPLSPVVDSIIPSSIATTPNPPPQRLSSSPSPASIDRSWSFSMLSDDEDEEEPPDVNVNTGSARSDKPKVLNTTPMANWQIGTASSVAEPTTIAPSKADNTTQSIPENDASTRDNIISNTRNSPAPSSRVVTPTNNIIPTFITPQKRAGGVSSDDDIMPTSRATKRISLPHVNKQQRRSSTSMEPSDIVEDFIAPPLPLPPPPPPPPPRSPSIALPSPPHILTRNTISAERSTPKSTFVSPSTGRPIPERQQKSSPGATVIQLITQNNKGTHQLGLLEAFKRKARIQHVAPAATTTNTAPADPTAATTTTTSAQNQSLVIQCDINQIKANYPAFKKQHDKTHMLSIADYLATTSTHHGTTSDIDMNARLISTTATHNGLSFYSRGGIFELGVANLKALGVHAIYNQLLKNHKVICKRKLNRPVQIQFQQDDPLCAALIALATKEAVVDDDLHGNKKMAYYEITEDCVVNNGFNVRWRKDLNSHNLIIQFIGIYSLGSGYGPSDFREILSLLDGSNNSSLVRPAKIRTHLWSVAEEMYEHDKSSVNLQDELQQLTWTHDITSKDWELGLSESGHVLACRRSYATTYHA